MFGHDHNEENKQDNNSTDNAQPMSTQPVNDGLLGINDDNQDTKQPDTPSAPPAPVGDDNFGDDTVGSVKGSQSSPNEADSQSISASAPTLDDSHDSSPDSSDDGTNDDLLDIKKEALDELSPLIDHLEQNSEEKFRTTMMMIQASDNKSLVPQAFQAAKEIQDDKKRAQALLDIVNEINYFTHKSND